MTDEQLLAVEPIQVAPGHERNPFADRILAGDKSVDDLAARWAILHGWASDQSAPIETDPFDALRDSLDSNTLPFIAGSDGAVFFPNSSEPAEWEARCQEMHADQVPIDPASMVQKVREGLPNQLNRGD